ncbi:MAG TPA: NUDIX hydrolase [Nocardioidaceae bacterium]|nr:NUDIX hydrolase [Nocardioidaceae bacterium]
MYSSEHPIFYVTADVVALTVRQGQLCVLLVERGGEPFRGALALPGGFVEPDEDLPAAAMRELEEETGIRVPPGRVEQLATFGNPERDPRHRVVSVAHLVVLPHGPDPTAGSDAAGARWWPVRSVEGRVLAFDHREILARGVERTRARLEYSALATEFVAEEFTVAELRAVYEAVWGQRLDPGNFHRKVTRTPGLLARVGRSVRRGPGRPAELFCFGGSTVLHPPLTREAFR